MIDYTIIGKRIQTRRQEQNITQEKLAERVGISVVYLSKIENGRVYPTLETLSNICTELDTELSAILPTRRLPAKTMPTSGCWSCSTPAPSGSSPSHFLFWKSFPSSERNKKVCCKMVSISQQTF